MRFRSISNGIVTRLLLLGLFLLIISFVGRYFALSKFLREDLTSVVEGQQLALATYVAHDIDAKIIQRQALLERLATTLPLGLLAQPERLRAWLKEHYDDQPLFSTGLFVVDANAVAIADYPVLSGRVNTSYADRDYIQAAIAGTSYIGRPVIGRSAKEPVLPIAAPIKNAQGKVQAVLVGVTALAAPGFLDSLLKTRIGAATGGFLLISPRDHLFVASSQPDMVLKPVPPPGVNALHDRAMAGFRGTGVTVNAKGVEEISAMVSVPSTGWFVVARLPTREAFATVGRTQDFLVKNLVWLVATFLIIGYIGLYFFFHPLFQAAAHADRMTRGELPLKPLTVVRNDEIGHFITAFNRLLVKLNDNQAEVTRLAYHDTLTGLPNRLLLSDRLRHELAQAQRNGTRIGLLFLDIDGFKHINDTLGHDAGDEALQQISARFIKVVREADTLARIGGDEFIVLLSNLGDDAEDVAGMVASKCIDALKAPFSISGKTCTLGVSIGIALGNGGSSSDALLLAADHAMYQAKASGRGRYVICQNMPNSTAA